MIEIKGKIKELYGFIPDDLAILKLAHWHKLFVEYNSHTNLMSKNELSTVIEKHVTDSLALSLVKDFKNGIRVVDIGAGGGFPSLMLAIFFPKIYFIAIESIAKKTKFLALCKNELELENFEVITGRAENIPPLNADIITNRAVGKIDEIWKYAGHHLKGNGLFISYKARNAKEEAKNCKLKNPKFISYKLPLKENYTRELVIFHNPSQFEAD